MLLIIILDWISGLLRSRHLYLSLISSLVWIFSSIGNGGVSDSERILKVLAAISMSPVFKFSLTAPLLLITSPSTAITNSLRSVYALSKPSLPIIFSSKRIWRIPLLSLKSTKISEPRFLLLATQPITVTFLPISADETSVHLCDLFKPTIDSAILLYLFPVINY